jgi:ATP-dependent protease HslVU (ClpYQ) peptidase subunit
MTCIVGVAHEGQVWVGGDSAGVAGHDVTVRTDRKVFRNGAFVMGFTTSFRMGQLLAVKLQPSRYHQEDDPWRYMVDSFIDDVRKCLKEGGFAKVENGVDRGGQFLVGFRGRLFNVAGDYQVGEATVGFDAVGCGESFALGSLAETSALEPEERVRHALIAAERFSGGVRGPFHIEKTDVVKP